MRIMICRVERKTNGTNVGLRVQSLILRDGWLSSCDDLR